MKVQIFSNNKKKNSVHIIYSGTLIIRTPGGPGKMVRIIESTYQIPIIKSTNYQGSWYELSRVFDNSNSQQHFTSIIRI